MPALDTAAPLRYYAVPRAERDARCQLDSDACIIDGSMHFVSGCLEIPVHGLYEPFSGWPNAAVLPYPDTASLKTHVHLRDGFIRPFIELELAGHPLAVEQRAGISVQRVAELYAFMMHGDRAAETRNRCSGLTSG